MAKHRRKGQPFAEAVRELAAEPVLESSDGTPTFDGASWWCDRTGTTFKARGDAQPPVRRVRRLMAEPECLVLWEYDKLAYVDIAEERARLLARAEPYLTGRSRDPDDFTDFDVYEMKDPHGRHALIFREYC